MNFIDTYQHHEQEKLTQKLLEMDIFADELTALNQTGWKNITEHGDFSRWSTGLNALPSVQLGDVNFSNLVRIGDASSSDMPADDIKSALKQLHPWRKGPFDLLGIHIDTEWRSDWKWDRVQQHISPLAGKVVLDIGCGSGYHLWRMLGQGARLALGIDPTSLFSMHFSCIKRYQPDASAFLIPTGIDEMPDQMHSFDTVFSMGILYHRREPLEHLTKIKGLLKKGGEMVLETLVIDGDEQTCLVPSGRYAKMRNVWFIPSVAMLELWLKRIGFSDVRCVDLNTTSVEEQRVTEWMEFESLSDYLDPADHNKTVEGYPAPKRAVMVAKV